MPTFGHRLGAWFTTWRTDCRRRYRPKASNTPVLIIVEGSHDVALLKRMSTLLAGSDVRLPNLVEWEATGRCLFLPAGGGDANGWTGRLGALELAEFHVYDRESSPTTELRRARVEGLNQRAHRRAFLTRKRALENYLHPTAIYAALGIELAIDDDTAVADSAARAIFARIDPDRDWNALPYRAWKRRRERAKRLLNTLVADHMTVELLTDRDPSREIAGWLRTIVALSAAR